MIDWSFPEDALPLDHPARVLWRVVQTLDLSAFTKHAKAVKGRAGRTLISRHLLLTLWIYAISIGIGSAREIARRIKTDTAFRWLVGDQTVSHSMLSAFRVSHREDLDQLFSDVLGTLLFRELISLEVVAQDGTRIRANAGSSSFRREKSLLEAREQAALHTKAVLADIADRSASGRGSHARVAAARDYQKRVDAAIRTVQSLRAAGKDEPRGSMTDAEARVMKMPDGGFRPAYNAQFATVGAADGGARTIVGVRVTNIGSDKNSLNPMLDDIERRTGRLPKAVLADGDHGAIECVTRATQRGVLVVVPIKNTAKKSSLDGEHYRYDTVESAAWRDRMKTDAIKALYRVRAGLCEFTNARLKGQQRLTQLPVRGTDRVTSVILLAALAANLVTHASALLA